MPLLLYLPDAARSAIGIALGLSVMVTALFYLLAHALQHAPLFAVAKEELSALIFSAIIISFWISAGAVIDPLVRGLILPAELAAGIPGQPPVSDLGASHITLAIASTDIFFQKIVELYTSMYLFEALIGFLSTISFPLGSPVAGTAIISFSLMPFDGLVLLSNAHTIIVESIGQFIGVLAAKKFILLFCRDVIPVIFLPLGLVFRAIPFLRTTGSSIIAICFAGFFILPLAVMFSNYLIFDIYQPADFIYAPEQAGPYKQGIEADKVKTQIDESRKEGSELLQLFSRPGLAEQTMTRQECSGNPIAVMFCSAGNILKGVYETGKALVTTVYRIWTFMMGLTGDFFSFLTNPLLPSSATAGLYYFIIDTVVVHGQFVVLIVVTSLFEIIFTITMYRNIAMLIGGELEIAGLGKLV